MLFLLSSNLSQNHSPHFRLSFPIPVYTFVFGPDHHLIGHLGILIRRSEVIILILILIIIHGVLLSGLGEVNDLATGTASSLDDVVQINLLQAILGLV